MMTLYHMQGSGNCYKLRLLMAQLELPFRLVDVDVLRGETRTASFLEKNPNGSVPLLELEDGQFLPESGAAMFYLADGARFLPTDRFLRAQILRWMFFEQYSHEPYIAVARFWRVFSPDGGAAKEDRFPEWMELGNQALTVMERHLSNNRFFAGDDYTIADIALYAYSHVAHEGGFELAPYPNIKAWLARVAEQPRHVTIDWRPEQTAEDLR
ncbi:disulfide-bond oxidoreductase YfcG [bacterium MnTg02]|nr:disulfide-bond oxidoreductase YfcG [bacterium MnTg02]